MKRLSVFLCAALCAAFVCAYDVQDAYKEFLQLNSAYTDSGETVLVKLRIVTHEQNEQHNSTADTYCLFHKNGQLVRINSKNKRHYFFSSDQGYWLYNKNLKTPLKISGSYKIEEFEVQDILKTDFKTEYKIIRTEGDILTLERQNQKSAYKFIIFRKTPEHDFELDFTDAQKVPVRKLVYHGGTVDGFPCFSRIDVFNLIFNKDSYNSWITDSVTKTEVPSALFSYSQLQALSRRLDALIK